MKSIISTFILLASANAFGNSANFLMDKIKSGDLVCSQENNSEFMKTSESLKFVFSEDEKIIKNTRSSILKQSNSGQISESRFIVDGLTCFNLDGSEDVNSSSCTIHARKKHINYSDLNYNNVDRREEEGFAEVSILYIAKENTFIANLSEVSTKNIRDFESESSFEIKEFYSNKGSPMLTGIRKAELHCHL